MHNSILEDGGRVALPLRKLGVGSTVALVVAHCAGMLDLVVLPVWVGALVERYGFGPQQAGALVTSFLLGAVVASIAAAALLHRLNKRLTAAGGFTFAALAFFFASHQSDLAVLAICHLAAGLSIGTALSMVHGTMGHSANPHRLYAIAGIAVGLLAILLLGGLPQILIAFGGPALFQVFAAIMLIAALTCITLFRNPPPPDAQQPPRFDRAIWFTIFGTIIMTFNQAMVFSFVEVIGKARGFQAENVLAVLIALGIVNFLIPSPLAAFLQNRLPAWRVVQAGPACQVILALAVTSTTIFPLWAVAASIFVAVQIFTHTFVFGLLAQLDPTGRAVAATPAMLMLGAALGPIVGGAMGENFGFGALGAGAVVMAAFSILFFTKARAQ